MKEKITMFEKVWVTVFTVLILGATCYFSYTGTDYTSTKSILINWVISPLSALTGIASVVLTAKGKLSSFWFGIVNTITYGYISFYGGIYGDTIINLAYFLPMQFVGLLVWKANMGSDGSVTNKFLKYPVRAIIISFVSWFAFTKLLNGFDHFLTTSMKKTSIFYETMPKGVGVWLDSFTEVGQFIGQILLTLGRVESWLFWFAINIVSIYMWTMVALANPANLAFAVPTLVMFFAYLLNSVYGYSVWSKRAKIKN